jgi:hypothetical protein
VVRAAWRAEWPAESRVILSLGLDGGELGGKQGEGGEEIGDRRAEEGHGRKVRSNEGEKFDSLRESEFNVMFQFWSEG